MPGPAPGPARGEWRGSETAVDDALVEETLGLLVAHDKVSVPWKRQIGAQILDEYFGGDDRLVRSFRPQRDKSFVELRKRAAGETTWSETALRRAVKAELVARGLPAGVVNRVAWSYWWQLYSIRNLDVRGRLAERIAARTLLGDAAEEAIAAAAEKERDGARPRRPGTVRVLKRLQRVFEDAAAAGSLDAAHLRRVGKEERRAAVELGERVKARIEDFIIRVKRTLD